MALFKLPDLRKPLSGLEDLVDSALHFRSPIKNTAQLLNAARQGDLSDVHFEIWRGMRGCGNVRVTATYDGLVNERAFHFEVDHGYDIDREHDPPGFYGVVSRRLIINAYTAHSTTLEKLAEENVSVDATLNRMPLREEIENLVYTSPDGERYAIDLHEFTDAA